MISSKKTGMVDGLLKGKTTEERFIRVTEPMATRAFGISEGRILVIIATVSSIM